MKMEMSRFCRSRRAASRRVNFGEWEEGMGTLFSSNVFACFVYFCLKRIRLVFRKLRFDTGLRFVDTVWKGS